MLEQDTNAPLLDGLHPRDSDTLSAPPPQAIQKTEETQGTEDIKNDEIETRAALDGLWEEIIKSPQLKR